jgi:hypothetical protein
MMSLKEWGTVLGSQILGNPFALVGSLIIAAVVFIVGFATLAAFGLISAVIYALFGLGFVWFIGTISKTALKKYWWISFIVPGFFVFGLLVDHLPFLSLSSLSMASKISGSAGLMSQEWTGAEMALVVGNVFVAVLALAFAMIVILLNSRKSLRKLF